MKVYEDKGSIILENVVDFSVEQTLECGQCFHFAKITDGEYVLSAYGKLLHVGQIRDKVTFFDTTMEEYNNIWKNYFDLDTDYSKIKAFLMNKDDKLTTAIETMDGVRILNQDFFETLISFIISQNKQIPHIKKIVAQISELYGTLLGNVCGENVYAFPDVNRMMDVTVDDLRECKTGFRAPYIRDAVEKVHNGLVTGSELKQMSLKDCELALTEIKGVGAKVANCVMLFSLGKREAFPVDVWIKRIMEYLYFDGNDTSKEKIMEFAAEHFGEYGGYAQQYLFYYGKTVKMGISDKK